MPPHNQVPHIPAIDRAPEMRALLQDLLADEPCRITTRDRLIPDLTLIAQLNPDLIILGSLESHVADDWAALERLAQQPTMAAIPIIVRTLGRREATDVAQFHHPRVTVRFEPCDVDHVLRVVREALALSALWRLTRS